MFLAFASNSTWKWKTGLAMSGKGTYYYDVFWQSVIRWLINAPYLKPVKINLTKQNFTTGEDVRIRIHVFDKYYKPISADIKLDIKTPDKKKINVDDISEVTAGEYETKVNFTEEGDYTLTAKAQKGNSILGTDSVHFKINLPNFEYTQANLNEELLKSISDETGGKYLHISNADKFEITYKSNIPKTFQNQSYLFGIYSHFLQ